MADLWRWWMRLAVVGVATATSTSRDTYTHVKFAKTATLWSVRGFLNVESPVDIGLFDHSCRRMEELLASRTAHSELQRMTFHTTSLAARRACATVEDWPHLFRGTPPIGGTRSGSVRREKRQLLIGAALGTVFGGILWNEISDWVQDTTATDAIERLQEDMAAQLHGGLRGQNSDEVRQGVSHPVRDYGVGVAHRQLRRSDLEVGQWTPADSAAAYRRGSSPHLDEVDEGAAPRTALRGGGAVGATCFLPP